MKKILLFFLLVTMHLTQTLAEEMGYTTGHYSRSSFFSLGTGARQGLAIRLSRQKLALLKGRKITGLKAIYGTKNLEKGKVTASCWAGAFKPSSPKSYLPHWDMTLLTTVFPSSAAWLKE